MGQTAEARALTGEVVEFPHEDDGNKLITTLRIDRDLLKRLDERAKRRGISRSAYLSFAASKALDEGW